MGTATRRRASPAAPAELEAALRDPSVTLIAHSAKFDWNIVRHALKIPTALSRWRCTQAQAYAHGLPGSLDLLGLVLGLKDDERKMAGFDVP